MPEERLRILSIDGGGIRGIVPAEVLAQLERHLQHVSRDPSLRIADCFDLIAGTSTGGILTCLYLCPGAASAPGHGTRPKFTAQQALELYLNYGDDIFDVPVFKHILSLGGIADERYPSGPLEHALERHVGDVRLSQLLKDCAITAYDIAEREVVIFNSRDNRAGDRPDKDYLLRDVARATSAAPTYFEAANIVALDGSVRPLIDGGLFANNPALCGYAELSARGQETPLREVALLSLGTGGNEKPFSYSEVKHWGAVEWARPLMEMTLTSMSEVVDYQLRKLFVAAGVSDQYLRIDPVLGPATNPDLDDATLLNMQRLQRDGARAYADHAAELSRFAERYLLRGGTAIV